MYGYSKALCEKNAASEGVGARCDFRRGDANRLDLSDEGVDAVVSNYGISQHCGRGQAGFAA